ncbi:MAG: energy transducer TonB [Chitinophagales bacterium]
MICDLFFTKKTTISTLQQLIGLFLILGFLLCLISCNTNAQNTTDQAQDPTDTSSSVVEEDLLINVVEIMPEFPGGQKQLLKWIKTELKYPPMARKNSIEGMVYIGFTVMEDGSIQNVHVKRGLPNGGAGCDAEAMRLVNKMPKWIPGTQMGKVIPIAYTLPFRFKLD